MLIIDVMSIKCNVHNQNDSWVLYYAFNLVCTNTNGLTLSNFSKKPLLNECLLSVILNDDNVSIGCIVDCHSLRWKNTIFETIKWRR